MEERILVGLDDSTESWTAFEYATSLAKELGTSKIAVAHSKEGGSEDVEDYRTGEEMLSEAEEKGKEKGIEIETHLLVRGLEPDEDLVKFAEENNFNHIIVGHKGRSSVGKVLLGSVADGVVEKSGCMVTVVRGICPIQT